MLAGFLDLVLEHRALGFILFEQLSRLELSFFHLLSEDFVFTVLQLSKILGLSFDHLLPNSLLLLESLLLSILLELVKSLLLDSILTLLFLF